MRRLILILVVGSLWAADPTITDLTTDSVTHSSARVTWTSSPATERQVAWDTTAYWDANHTMRYSTSEFDNTKTAQTAILTGLTPSTAYTACPLVGSIGCDDASDPHTDFTTSAEPGTHPATPTLPDLSALHFTAVPTADATLNVASDCSDLESKIATAAGATYTDQTVHVVIPAGTTCTIGTEAQSPDWLTLPNKTGSGWIVIRSGGTLPAFGTRIDPDTDSAQLATISSTGGSSGNGTYYTGQYESWRSHHYWFSGIHFTYPAIASTNDVTATSYHRTLVTQGAGTHDFTYDRCWFDGRGYPDRTLIAWLGGSATEPPYNIAFLENYWSGFDVWRAYQSGIAVTHTSTSLNTYTGGHVYVGNADVTVSPFSIQLGGSGSGHFRLYVERDGSVHFDHDIATLDPTCTGCTATYDASLAVPADAFSLFASDGSWEEGVITNATFLNGAATTGDPWTVQNNSADVGGAGSEGGFGLYLSGTHDVRVHNNYFGVTGIGVYSEGGTSNYDMEFTRNTFQSDPNLFVHTAGDSNRVGLRRQHFELKDGHTVLVEGNQFLDAWVGVSGVPSSAIYMANRENGVQHDLTIKNNLIVDHPSCFQLFGNEPIYTHNPQLYNLLLENNVCEANAFERSLFTFGPGYDGGMRGHQIEALMGGEDWTIRHNTFYGGIGSQPSLLRLTDAFFEGLTVQDNIFFLQQSEMGASWGKGLHSRTVYATAGGVPDLSTIRYGTAALNAIAIRVPSTQSWTFDHNVIVVGCTDPTSCESAETDLLTVATEEAAYPSGNFWPTGSTYGARITAVGWTTPGAGIKSDYSLTAKSAYKGLGTAASDPGVNWTELQAALTGEETEPLPEESSLFISGSITITGSVTLIP